MNFPFAAAIDATNAAIREIITALPASESALETAINAAISLRMAEAEAMGRDREFASVFAQYAVRSMLVEEYELQGMSERASDAETDFRAIARAAVHVVRARAR